MKILALDQTVARGTGLTHIDIVFKGIHRRSSLEVGMGRPSWFGMGLLKLNRSTVMDVCRGIDI
jgi:hypothetical protein